MNKNFEQNLTQLSNVYAAEVLLNETKCKIRININLITTEQ